MLEKSIEVSARSRPIKVAYLVPFEETDRAHLILDAVFCEAHTRWGGTKTLILPVDADVTQVEHFYNWLAFFDPDFVYSFVDLSEGLIMQMAQNFNPVAFLSHKYQSVTEDSGIWRNLIPDWNIWFNALSSISTIHSPFVYQYSKENMYVPVILTCHKEPGRSRFFSDNFGREYRLYSFPNPIKGFFDTCCLTDEDLPEIMNVGTKRIHSYSEVLRGITENNAITFAQLANAHVDTFQDSYNSEWSRAFNLFIGNTVADRINFWNARSLSTSYKGSLGALLISKELLEDEDFTKNLGNFLNKLNFIGQSNGQPKVCLRSNSLDFSEIEEIKKLLKASTWNDLRIPENFNFWALPSQEDIKRKIFPSKENTKIFRLNEDKNKIIAEKPDHMIYSPGRFVGFHYGQWMVDLHIERHNSYSRVVNQIDEWLLPRRNSVTYAFTNNLSRISKEQSLSVLPSSSDSPFPSGPSKVPIFFNLNLPSDDEVFRYLLLHDEVSNPDDLRQRVTKSRLSGIEISDKGQMLRGILSMFHDLSTATEILTNRIWREIIRGRTGNRGLGDSEKHQRIAQEKFYSYKQLEGFVPNDEKFKMQVQKNIGLDKICKATEYIRSAFKDTLTYLVEREIFFRTHRWKCPYCGHWNSLALENIRELNNCDICKSVYMVPLEVTFDYKVNAFVHGALKNQNELSVLCAIRYLMNGPFATSFYFSPEVNLFFSAAKGNNEKCEIDLLCILEGLFYAIEVKRYAQSFIECDDQKESFIKKMELLQPDVGILFFEEYCEESELISEVKEKIEKIVDDIRIKVGEKTKIDLIVFAEKDASYNSYSLDVGIIGSELMKFYDKLE